MMKISTKGVYALEAMIELASRADTCVSIRDIAEARNCYQYTREGRRLSDCKKS